MGPAEPTGEPGGRIERLTDRLYAGPGPGVERRLEHSKTTGRTTLATTVTLIKGAHKWRFVCPKGEEPQMRRALAELAERDGCPLDFHDASLVEKELRRNIGTGLNEAPGSADNH